MTYHSPCTCDYESQLCAGCRHPARAHTIGQGDLVACPIHGRFGTCIRFGCGCQEMAATLEAL